MAGDHDYISGTDVDEQICPVLGVHLRGVGRELLPEIEVGEVLAVGLGVMFRGRGVKDPQRVEVPFSPRMTTWELIGYARYPGMRHVHPAFCLT